MSLKQAHAESQQYHKIANIIAVLQTVISISGGIAGDLGVPGLQSGLGALSTVLKLIQVRLLQRCAVVTLMEVFGAM